MPLHHFSNLRLLSSTFTSPFFFLSSASPLIKLSPFSKPRLSSLVVFSSSFSRRRHNSPNFNRRLSTSPDRSKNSDSKGKDSNFVMEEENAVVGGGVPGFNKRRAEGKDKSDKPRKNLQLKVRKLNPVNTLCYVQILGTGMDTQDTSPSVLLFFDKQRFIFNAGEGLQRFCTEHKIKLSKIDHIFLSRVCSETAGGLPGLLLTLAGMGDEGMSVNVWGPSDLKYLVDAMKFFIPNAAMVHTRSFGPEPGSDGAIVSRSAECTDPIVLVNDEVVKISAYLLRPSGSKGSNLMEEGPILSPHRQNGGRPLSKPGDHSVVYVCELPEIMGKFDPGKAKALGLRPGPKYRELQLGKSVMSDKKNIMIHPSDVMDPSIPGPILFLVDCPTISHFHELLSINSLSSYYGDSSGHSGEGTKTVNCVIHLSPASVVRDPDYQKWMSNLGAAQHIMAGHEMKNIEVPILKASARIATRLNYLCPQIFPAPGYWTIQNLGLSEAGSTVSSESPKLFDGISAENLLKFHMRPFSQLGLDSSAIPSRKSSLEIIEELHAEIPEVVDAAENIRQLWRSPRNNDISPMQHDKIIEEPWLNENSLPSCLENISREDMEIVLLGTGSSQPSKYRNVSAVYVNLFSKGGVLLDCGEGTLGQLKRRFGLRGADDVVRGLKFIWISHIHADHHTGLARLLARRHQLLEGVPHEPLLVIGPWMLKRYLDAYQRLEDLNVQFLDCKYTTEASLSALSAEIEPIDQPCTPGSPNGSGQIGAHQRNQSIDKTLFAKGSRMQSFSTRPINPLENKAVIPILKNMRKILSEAGLDAILSFYVVHCPNAFGVVLKASERHNGIGKVIPGWKLVYSGDTRPCPELIDAARGATVLIHEATFEDGMVEEAIAKNHSTTKEAMEVGDSAGAYRVILTHFSQRYPKIPVFDETHMHKACIAFDMMSVNAADLPVLPSVLPYIRLLFRDEMIVDDSEDVVSSIGVES